MLLMDYTSIRGEDFSDHDKKSTCNLVNTYIDVHSQRLIGEYPGDGVQAITRLKPQCAKIIFAEKSR